MRILILLVSIPLLTSFMGIPSHIATPPTLLQTFEYCRDKLYTKYPDEMLQEEWRTCMER
jgi:hypothetical protein